MNLNNSVNNERESKKRLNNISIRIKRLENDINRIKSKGKDKEKGKERIYFISPNKTYNDDKLITTIDEYKSTKNNKNKIDNFIKKNNLYNSMNINKNYLRKNKKHQLYEKKILNKLSNYNNMIHVKKKFNFNKKSLLNKIVKNNRYNNLDIDDNNIKIKKLPNKNPIQLRNFFSFSQSYTSNTENKDEVDKKINLDNFRKNNMEKLGYVFEIRNLKKKLNILLKEKNELNEKLNGIKQINKDIENNIFRIEKEENIFNKLISLNKQYIIEKNQNGGEYASNNKNNINNSIENNITIENIILNIMEMKFDYDNNLLKDEFVNGLNKLLNVSSLKDTNFKILMKKINDLIDENNILINYINTYKFLLIEDNKYYEYFTSLINKLNLNKISDLDEFIKGLFYENIRENNNMKKIQNTLMNNTLLSLEPKKQRRNHYYSTNKIIKNFGEEKNNKFFRANNFINDKKSDSKIDKNKIDYYLTNRKKFPNNHLNKKILNKTEQTGNNNINNNLRNNLLSSFDNRQNNNFDKRKKINININNFNKRNTNYDIINTINKSITKNSLCNTEEDMGDIKYYNNNERNKIRKHLTSNNFNKNFYGHVKNNSVIIVNK